MASDFGGLEEILSRNLCLLLEVLPIVPTFLRAVSSRNRLRVIVDRDKARRGEMGQYQVEIIPFQLCSRHFLAM